MKKTFFLLLLIIPFFVACSDDDKTSAVFYQDGDLVGTKWQTRYLGYEVLFGQEAFIIYEFKTIDEVIKYAIKDGVIIRDFGTYTYTLDYPILYIKMGDLVLEKFKIIDSETIIDTKIDVPNMIAYTRYKRIK